MVAIDRYDGEVVSVGHKALKLLGREPRGIEVHRPIRSGTIFNFEVAQKMLRTFIGQVTLDIAGVISSLVFPAQRLRSNNVRCAMPRAMPAAVASILLTKDWRQDSAPDSLLTMNARISSSTSVAARPTSRSSLRVES